MVYQTKTRKDASARLSDDEGFTLIELMITLMVLSVGVLGITAAFMGTLKATQHSDARTRATAFTAQHIEELRSRGFDGLGSTTESATEIVNGVTFVTHSEVNLASGTTNGGATVNSAFKRITATTTWTIGNTTGSVSSSSDVFPDATVRTDCPKPTSGLVGAPNLTGILNPDFTTTQIKLNWTPGTPPGDVYKLEMEFLNDDTGVWSERATLLDCIPGTASEYLVTSLAEGTTYRFTLTSSNSINTAAHIFELATFGESGGVCTYNAATATPSPADKHNSQARLMKDVSLQLATSGGPVCNTLIYALVETSTGQRQQVVLSYSNNNWIGTLLKSSTPWSVGTKQVYFSTSNFWDTTLTPPGPPLANRVATLQLQVTP